MSDNRFRQVLLSLMIGGALAITGCASTGQKEIKEEARAETGKEADAAKSGAQKVEEKKILIEYINVVGDGDRVLIGTTGSVKYTVFKLSDPARLIVDMPGVNLDKVSSSISVNNDFLREISALNYGEEKDIGRIIIGLNEGVDHEIKSGENSILVSLKKNPQAALDTAPALVKAAAVEEPPKAAPEPGIKEEPAPSLDSAAPADAKPVQLAQAAPGEKAEAQSAGPAKKIIGITSSREGENTVIRILTDGTVGNYNSFDLDAPSRIVIDVWGVDSNIGKDTVKVDNKYVKAVRIGSHPDKARLVFDSASKRLPAHSVKKEDNAIIVTMGPKVQKAEPAGLEAKGVKGVQIAAAKAEPAAEPAEKVIETAREEAPKAAPDEVKEAASAQEESPAASIRGVEFKKVGDKGRLTVSSSAKPDYTVKESADGKTVVIDIKGAVIPDGLTRTLDASKLKTPVLSISSYQESVKPVRDVRILVKLREKPAFEVKEENGSISVDFSSPASPEIQAAKAEPVLDAKAAARGYSGKRIDLDMIDANVTDILRLLAEVSNLNIIASDDVKGTISLRLKNVPWDQAFDIILKSKDLDQIREGNVVRVAPAAKIRQEKEAMLVSKKAQEKLENLEIQFVPISYAKSEDLVKQVQGTLTERGSVTSDTRTNTLIIKDLRQGIDSAVALVKKLDTPIPQVLIEARIVEAESTFARDLGIQWGADFQTGGHVGSNTFGSTNQIGQVPPTPGAALGPGPSPFTAGSGVKDFAVNLPATGGTAGTLGALGFVLGKAGRNPLVLDLRLSAGEVEGHLKTISRPRITTMDNKEAKIEQGESIPFESTSASGTQTIFVDANLSLTVTPHITPDGSVLMKIRASRNSIGTFRTSAGQPSINKKESSTEVLVSNGETTVIGGIVVSDKSETEKGIPLLKDIPIIGWLFKNKLVSDTQKELLIFITPTIMKEKITG